MCPKVCTLLFPESSASVLIGFEMYMNRSRMSNEKASRLKILSTEVLLKGYPWLTQEDIQACLLYARKVIGHERVEPIRPADAEV